MEKQTDGGECREEVIDSPNDVLWPSRAPQYKDTTTLVAAGGFIWISHHKTLFIIIIFPFVSSVAIYPSRAVIIGKKKNHYCQEMWNCRASVIAHGLK